MIYDFFMYSDYQPEMLEIRLETLDDVVDCFVVGESEFTHSGEFRGVNKWPADLLKKFEHKIRRISVPYQPHENPWAHEMFQRQYPFDQVQHEIAPEDVILMSDLDEIPLKERFIQEVEQLERPVSLCGDYFMFCVDLYGRKSIDGVIMRKGWINQERHLNWFRSHRTNFQHKDLFKHAGRSSAHFSTVGTPENIVRKLKAFAHCGDIAEEVKNEAFIIDCIKNKKGDYKNSDILVQVELTKKNAPDFLVDNPEKFKHLTYKEYV